VPHKRTFSESFVSYAEEFTDCPAVLLKWSGYLAISAVLGRNVVLRSGIWDVVPNLWMVLIGPSSVHKSTALKVATSIVRGVMPDIALAQEWSHEKLLEDIKNKPHCLMVYDECRSFFDACAKKYNEGIMSALTTLWAEDTYSRTTKGSNVEIREAYICFGGASTAEWMTESIKDKNSAILSGFLPRFLLVGAPKIQEKVFPFPPPYDRIKRQGLIDQLGRIAQFSGEIHYSEDGRKDYERWYLEFYRRLEKADALAQPFLNKLLMVYSHRLAIITAADLGTFPLITSESFRETKLMIGYLERTIHGIVEQVSETKWDKERRKIAQTIQDATEIRRSDLSNKTRVYGTRLHSYLDDLEGAGKIELEDLTNGRGGRPTQLIRWKVGHGNGVG
jgi:hypothetical protein